MIVTLRSDADAEAVRHALIGRGLWVRAYGSAAAGGPAHYLVQTGSAAVSPAELGAIEGVAAVAAPESQHPLLDGQPKPVAVGCLAVGPPPAAEPVLIAGPCSVESREGIHAIAARLARLGVRLLRGGAYKPRTSPYSFQGHGERALGWLREAADQNGMLVVTEALGVEELAAVAEVADLVQIGSRNMQHTPLLRAAGTAGKPILLKRGMASTVEEWLQAAEYCLLHGAPGVILCERGVRGFEPSMRHLVDLGSVALLAEVCGLPVVVDPSHGAGRRDLIVPLGRAALAAGAAGLMVETHDDPGRALSDGPQAVPVDEMAAVVELVARDRPARTYSPR